MDAPGEAGQQAVLQIPFSRLDPNPRQPRRHFDPGRMAELSQSVAHEGVIQPILVTRKGERFEVVAGERRLRAAQEAGLESVPALLTTVSEEESLKLALVENLQRDDLNPIEEARAFQVMIGEFGWTQEELGAHLGRDRSTVSNTLRLLQLPEEVQGMLESGRLSAGHVRALIKLDREACLELARDIQSRRLSVRQAERLAQSRKRAPAATQAANAPEDALLRSLRERIESRLGLPIQLQYHRGRGKLVVSFGSDGELERIMQTLGVTLDDGF
jgi:ParB family chromosome partitioning protein